MLNKIISDLQFGSQLQAFEDGVTLFAPSNAAIQWVPHNLKPPTIPSPVQLQIAFLIKVFTGLDALAANADSTFC